MGQQVEIHVTDIRTGIVRVHKVVGTATAGALRESEADKPDDGGW